MCMDDRRADLGDDHQEPLDKNYPGRHENRDSYRHTLNKGLDFKDTLNNPPLDCRYYINVYNQF